MPSIVEQYHRDREAADTGEGKRRVWRTYARAVIEEKASRPFGGYLPWRRAMGDCDLPVRYPPYWAKLPLADLDALWLALERARHRVSDE